MSTSALDHLILFLPSGPDQKPIIPSFLAENFALTPGGTHADNLTSNTLILLADGCYIELISFINPSSPAISTHWWGPNPERRGWTDWCLTTSDGAEANWARVKGTHGNPVEGGRKRPDGKDVKWAVTFPVGENGGQTQRGKVPFFCHDITPRDLRVPLSAEKTTHSCGAVGVDELAVIVKDREVLEMLQETYSAIFGKKGEVKGDEIRFSIERVVDVSELRRGPTIVLRLPRTEEEAAKVTDKDFWFGDVVLAAKADKKDIGERRRIDQSKDSVGGIWIEYVR